MSKEGRKAYEDGLGAEFLSSFLLGGYGINRYIE